MTKMKIYCLRQNLETAKMIESHLLMKKKGTVELKIKLKMKRDWGIQQRLMRLMKQVRMGMVGVTGNTI